MADIIAFIKQNMIKRILLIVLAIFAALLVIGGSFYAGTRYGLSQPREVKITGINNAEPKEGNVDFNKFWEAWDVLKTNFVNGKNIDNQAMVYGAISGMVHSLNDPYTEFFNPTDAQKFKEDINGKFGGVGMEIGIKNNQLVIIAPLKGTPAERAGLKPLDMILKIDDKATDGLDVTSAVKIIRGDPGTKVTLMIFRDGWEKPKDFVLTREVIQTPTLDMKMMEGKVAYIQLYSFNENAPNLFNQAIVQAAKEGANGIVLDLRGNPGGYLEVAVNLSGWFMDKGKVVVSEKFRSGQEDFFRANGNAALKNVPVVVLINKGSASASEILAGALRDNRQVKLVGEKSFGKGSVQQMETLSDGSMIKVTVAKWITPSGQVIDHNGLEPDVKVEISDKDLANKNDPQLNKALELIKQQIVLNK